LKRVQIKVEYDQLLKMKPVNQSGSALGTHRFQRAFGKRRIEKQPRRLAKSTLEAMCTQAHANYRIDYKRVLFAQSSIN
jgi:hypothetical protein